MMKKEKTIFFLITIIAIILNCFSGILIFPALAMNMQYYLHPIVAFPLLFLLPMAFIVSAIGVFQKRKWARNIFIVITSICSFLLAIVFLVFPILDIFLIIFIIFFFYYYFKPSIWQEFK